MKNYESHTDCAVDMVAARAKLATVETLRVWSNTTYTFTLCRQNGWCYVGVMHNGSKKLVDEFPMGSDDVLHAMKVMSAIYPEAF